MQRSTTSERRILVTGVSGQVGFELVRSLQGLGQIVSADRHVLDLADLDQVRAVVRDLRPSLIVNPAAYTAVDKAESEPELATRVNAQAPAVLAEEAHKIGARLIHYSTDYVFNGEKEGPYVENDATDPQNVYGQSKLEGERAIAESGVPHLIFRTSWVYGTRGKNFLLTMMRLGRERSELKVVADQFGAPTWSNTIAALTAHVIAKSLASDDVAEWWADRSGIYHLTADGSTSWFGFAEAIFDSLAVGRTPEVLPIATADYPTPAKRPGNSRLSNEKLTCAFGLCVPHWRDALQLCLDGC